MHFWNQSIGWLQVGHGGPYTDLYRTTDAGRPWIESIRRTPADFAFVRFFNGVEGVATEAAGNISATSDGGVTWVLQGTLPEPTSTGRCVPYFTSQARGWCFEAPSLQQPAVVVDSTSDGGASWQRSTATGFEGPTADLSGARFTDPGRGAQAGWIPVVVPGGSPAILYSPDGGLAWEKHVFTSPQAAVTRGGILVGTGTGQRLVLVTQWQVSQADTNAILYAHRSDDGGRTWREPVALPVIPVGVLPVALASVTDWAVVDGRNLWATHDGGGTWVSVPSSLNVEVRVGGLDLARDGSLWVLDLGRSGSAPALLRSTNGGYHWDSVPLPR